MDSSLLGSHLASARSARGLSFRALREATGLGLGHLQRLERGEVRDPGVLTLARLALALRLDIDELVRLAVADARADADSRDEGGAARG